MNKNINALYISYDGMTDPLGESQVIPYLKELSKKNINIKILSAEKPEIYNSRKKHISEKLNKFGIKWIPVTYTKNPPVVSTIKDIYKLKRTARKLYKTNKFDIVHCRSYISAFVGLYLKKKFGVKFIFDMRGFYADERVDGNLWPQNNPVFRAVYKYFKKKEKEFLKTADHVISLTYEGKNIIQKMSGLHKINIDVIPCCADTQHFDYNKLKTDTKNALKNKFNITNDNFILSYLGSLGTWYMPEEMMAFFKTLLEFKPKAKFLIITKDNIENVHKLAEKYNISSDKLIITSANREEVPSLLLLSDLSIFFIKPVFSKKASSPTKLAELLGMGIPVVCNSNVGDIDKFIPENNLGILINSFDDETYKKACKQIDDVVNIDKSHLRNVACNLFSLEKGSEIYYQVYNKLTKA